MKNKEFIDNYGRHFSTVAEMCAANNIKPATYYQRLHRGEDVASAIDKNHAPCGHKKVPIMDHLGNIYESKDALCKAYKINRITFQKRQKLGYSLEEILCGTIIAPNGKRYQTYKEVALDYNTPPDILRQRLYIGMDLEKALTVEYIKERRGRKNGKKDSKI